MTTPVRILLVEDSRADAELIGATLAADGLAAVCDRVATADDFLARLPGDYQLILSDYSLPSFDGIAAQEIARQRRPDLPFVFVSGTMGEEVVIDRLKAGATDFVLKQRLTRLPGAVRRALQEARARQERDRAQAEVRRLHAELEQRVEDRTRQLAKANDALAERSAELQKATAFLDSIVEHLPAIVFVKDAQERRFVLFNRAGEELLGLSRGDVLGRTTDEVFSPEVAQRLSAHDADVLECRVPASVVEEVIDTKHKGMRFVHTKKTPIAGADGRPEYLLGIALDITDRRAAEEAARLAKLEAERANRTKSEFLSRMSHDLRTPLNAILGFAQLLETDPLLAGEQLENVRQILKGGSHLLELINEVLDISRIEAGHLSLSIEPLQVSELVREVVDLMRPLASVRRISLAVQLPAGADLCLLADRQRLRQVLVNLVGNAVKYNRDGGAVRIDGTRLGERVRLHVADTGPGIPPEKRQLLFQPFERLGAERSAVEGTGLGLAVAKRLIEAMSGRIGAESSDEGATFWVELPVADENGRTTAGESTAQSVRRHDKGTILYIEDNRLNIRLVERLLTRRPGVRLVAAGTGADGIAAAIREHPRVILLDLHLPDITGEEVLNRLRGDDRTAHIPVAVLSADVTGVQSERLRSMGAQAYLTKPLVLASLLDLIDAHLDGAQGTQPL
jgi:PAS domain S-box-containing protein